MKRRFALLLGPAAALAAAAPAAAGDVQVNGLDTLVWDKPTVNILPGDTVTWKFDGTTQPHNAQSGSPNWTFASPTAAPAPPASFKFDAVGTYRFVCAVHPDTMVGDVIVGNPPPPPPPPLSEQPFVNDSTPPTVPETGGLDTTKPTVRSLRVRRSGRAARVSLRVSERSWVIVKLKRGSKTVKTKLAAGAGRLRLTVGARKLRAGRYRVEIRAVDVAGNASGLRSARLTLR